MYLNFCLNKTTKNPQTNNGWIKMRKTTVEIAEMKWNCNKKIHENELKIKTNDKY